MSERTLYARMDTSDNKTLKKYLEVWKGAYAINVDNLNMMTTKTVDSERPVILDLSIKKLQAEYKTASHLDDKHVFKSSFTRFTGWNWFIQHLVSSLSRIQSQNAVILGLNHGPVAQRIEHLHMIEEKTGHKVIASFNPAYDTLQELDHLIADFGQIAVEGLDTIPALAQRWTLAHLSLRKAKSPDLKVFLNNYKPSALLMAYDVDGVILPAKPHKNHPIYAGTYPYTFLDFVTEDKMGENMDAEKHLLNTFLNHQAMEQAWKSAPVYIWRLSDGED